MRNKLESIWEEIIRYSNKKALLDSNIIVHYEKKSEFFDSFYKNYNDFKRNYMSEKVVYLDRHKVAAILMYTVIDIGIIDLKNNDHDKLFLDNYYLAFSLGFSYMLFEMNSYNKEKHLSKFEFPDTLFNDKAYKDYFVNMLYVSYNESNLNLLELANALFLIESFNLKQKQ